MNDRLFDVDEPIVYTSALGMGIDKPDLGFVIRYQSASSASPTTSSSAAPDARHRTRRSWIDF